MTTITHLRRSTFLVLLLPVHAAFADVQLTTGSDSALVGDTIEFTYEADFSADPTFGGGTDFFYDPAVLQFVGWTFDVAFTQDDPVFRRAPTDCQVTMGDAGCDFDSDEFGAGLAQLNGLSWGNGQDGGIPGPVVVGKLTFVAVGAGSATVMMAANDDGVAGNPGPFVSAVTFTIQTVAFGADTVDVVAATDTDNDTIPDALDNCSAAANTDQRDTNGDGFGNLCDPDLNNDCIVNAIDLGLFRSVFFTTDADADFNGDGIVNTIDLGLLKAGFFAPPGPSGTAACP